MTQPSDAPSPAGGRNGTLYEIFSSTAGQSPEAIAIEVPPSRQRAVRQKDSYRDIEAAAVDLSRRIRARIAGECVVAILLERDSSALYVAQLAALRAGAAYTCLDPHFPDDHARFILEDSRARVLVTDRAGGARPGLLAGLDIATIDLDYARNEPAPEWREPSWLQPHSAAYVIYTSGTTGRPKGVVVEHRSIVHLVREDAREFGLGPGDRVAQGSSSAYDSSIEETWLAFAVGATLVVLDDETVRSGPDLLPWLRSERIAVFCPPPTLLRSIDATDPRRELPDLKLLYVGGEALPRDIADLFAPGRRLENGYGPTECTVTVVRGPVRAGEVVTIGRPIEGNTAHVLGPDLTPVPEGAEGELVLSGLSLARGYLNRPELDLEKFPTIPGIGRAYRTGDLVRRLPSGELDYLGRLDSQVKLRGYRIELDAVDAAIRATDGVLEAASRLQGEGGAALLVAFVVPRDRNAPPDLETLRRNLAERLPSYMVPARLAILSELPRSAGKKLDRKRLPVIGVADHRTGSIAPTTATERLVAEAMRAALHLESLPGTTADFFHELGGSSLTAAILVSTLRRDRRGADVTVRDLYETRTVAALAAHIDSAPPVVDVTDVGDRRRGGRPVATSVLQAFWLLFLLVIASFGGYAAAFVVAPVLYATLGATGFYLAVPGILALAVVAHAYLSVHATRVAKRLLIGRYEAISAPVWGSFYLRHWMLLTLARTIPFELFHGTLFQSWALRTLGARIGARVHIHRGVRLAGGGWDLLEIGDDAVLAQDAAIRLVNLVDGRIEAGPIKIGAGAKVDVRAALMPHTEMGSGSLLQALSVLAPGRSIGAGEAWDGVYAEKVGPAPQRAARPELEITPLSFTTRLLLARALRGLVVSVLPLAMAIGAALRFYGIDCGDALERIGELDVGRPLVLVLLVLTPLELLVSLLLRAAYSRALGRVEAGEIPRQSGAYIRVLMKTENLERAGVWLSGTLFWPLWLRLAGMRVGRDSEVSTIIDVVPELVEIGPRSFFADGIYVGGPIVWDGRVRLARTRIGEHDFIGNHAYLPAGGDLGDDVLVGLSTVADARARSAHSSWFGHPAIELPRREIVEMDETLTHRPGAVRYLTRLFWETLRFFVPIPPILAWLTWLQLLIACDQRFAAPTTAAVLVPALTLATFVGLALLVLVTKWILLGKVRPARHALWSCWCSRWDFHYVLWTQYALGFLATLEGTLWLVPYLRAMGSKIGKRPVLGPGFAQVVDPDMLEVGDEATVNGLLQAHTFEDRVLKIDVVRIGARADVGSGAVLFFGADIGQGAVVAPHSVVMKHEKLTAGRFFVGCPTRPAPRPEAIAVAPAAAPEGVPSQRLVALDVARGLALVGMMYMHLVPMDATDGFVDLSAGAFARHLYGKSAALFAVLLGFGLALRAKRREGFRAAALRLLGRAAALYAIGWILAATVWSTEVLRAIALMTLVVGCLARLPFRSLCLAFAVVIAAVPFIAHLGIAAESDWRGDGTHLGCTGFDLAALRYLFVNGNYPFVAWSALPLFGALLARVDWLGSRRPTAIFFALGLAALVFHAYALAVGEGEAIFGAAAPYLGVHWTPASLPFLITGMAFSALVIAATFLWQRFGPRAARPGVLALLGRATLTHYVGHILTAYLLLGTLYPEEDWPATAGLAALAAYLLFAAATTRRWFGKHSKGPLEALLAAIESRR